MSLRVPIDSFPSEIHEPLRALDDGDGVIRAVEVDRDRDGYLDCRHYRKDFEFLKLQNHLLEKRLIRGVFQPQAGKCREPQPKRGEFAWMEIQEGTGAPRLWAYFDREEERKSFLKKHPQLQSKIELPAAAVEKELLSLWDEVDSSRDVPGDYYLTVPHLNRPPPGSSRSGAYYGVDVTELFAFPEAPLQKVNQRGENEQNCLNAAFWLAGTEPTPRYYSEKDLQRQLQDPSLWQVASDSRQGDLILWVTHEDVPVHAFIDLGQGWTLTKNGYDDRQPLRLQKLEHLRHLYEQTVAWELEDKRGVFPVLKELRYRRVGESVR